MYALSLCSRSMEASEEMIFSNAYAFPGLTLVADDDPAGQMLIMSRRARERERERGGPSPEAESERGAQMVTTWALRSENFIHVLSFPNFSDVSELLV